MSSLETFLGCCGCLVASESSFKTYSVTSFKSEQLTCTSHRTKLILVTFSVLNSLMVELQIVLGYSTVFVEDYWPKSRILA